MLYAIAMGQIIIYLAGLIASHRSDGLFLGRRVVPCVMCRLQEGELLVLEALKWNVSRITAHDILDHIIARLPFNAEQRHVVRRHAATFIVLCITGSSPL